MNDRLFFERNPERRFRLRAPTKTDRREGFPGNAVLVEQLVPGVRLRRPFRLRPLPPADSFDDAHCEQLLRCIDAPGLVFLPGGTAGPLN